MVLAGLPEFGCEKKCLKKKKCRLTNALFCTTVIHTYETPFVEMGNFSIVSSYP